MEISRRKLLRTGLYLGAAAGVATVGWQFRPTLAADGPVDRALPAGSGPSLLIVYGSMMGSTGTQAGWMADTATQAGYRVQLAAAETAPAPDAFDAVILGSAIRAASWVEPMIDWAAGHEAAIAARPHSLFQCSMTCAGMLLGNGNGRLTPEQQQELKRDGDALFTAAPLLADAPVRYFPGRLEYRFLTPLLRLGYPFVSGSIMTGDYRKKDVAQQWAAQAIPVIG